MASVGVLNAELQLRIDNLMRNADTASKRMQSVANTIQDAFGKTDYITPLRESVQGLGHDFRNITSGIIIAQTFYQTLNAAQAAASAIWEYTDALNASQVAFGNLFGNYDLASEFVAVLQEYATRSPFDFRDVQSAAQSLRAYGIEAENLMFVIQGIGNLASVTGNYSETFNRVARAIGQINTRGKLMGEEMRQLAEAGLNVDAVYQRLGITAGEVADANISSAEAINAIVDVLNESYGDAVAAANTTMQGILANMRDLALSIISSIIQPVYEGVHSMLYTISQGINEFQQLFNAGGLGNAISQMFGSDVLSTLQNFMAIVIQLGQSILQVLYPALRIVGQTLLAIITAATPVISVISMLLSILGNLANFLLNNAAAMRILQGILMALATAFILNRVAAAGMLILQVVSRVIAFFSTVAMAASQALQVMSIYLAAGAGAAVAAGKGWVAFASALNVNPLILAISVIAALIAALIGLRSLLGGVSDVAANMTSFEPSNFLGSIPAASGDINKFNNRLQDTNNQLNDMADGLGNAGKAAEKAVEGLLSFDEVFSLPDANDPTLGGGGLGGVGDVGDVSIPDLGDIGAGIPDVPLFDWDKLLGYGQLTSIWGSIVDFFKNLEWPDIASYISTGIISAIASMGTTFLSGALSSLFSGGISGLGSFLAQGANWSTFLTGLKNGIIAGLLSMGFDFVFETIADMLRESGNRMAGNIVDSLSTPIASGLATLIVTKNPFAAAGAAVASGIFEAIQTGMNTGDWSGAVSGILGGIGGVLSMAIAKTPAGMFLGFGSVVTNGIFDGIAQTMEEEGNTQGAEMVRHVGDIVSTAFSGAAIGSIFGPVGMAIGGAVGAIAGAVMTFWDDISNWWTSTAWPWLQDLPGKINDALGGVPGKVIDAGANIIKGLGEGIQTGWETVSTFFTNLGSSIQKLINDPQGWLETDGKQIIEGIGNGISSAWETVSTWFGELPTRIGEFFISAGEWLWNAGSDIIGGIGDGISAKWEEIVLWFQDLPNKIGQFFTDAWNWLFGGGEDTMEGYDSGLDTGYENNVSTFFTDLPGKIAGFFTDAGTWLLNAGSDIIGGIGDGLSQGWETVSTWFGDLPTNIGNFFTDAGDWLVDRGEDIIGGLQSGAESAWNAAGDFFGGIGDGVLSFFSGAYNWLTGSGSETIEGYEDGASDAYNTLSSWLNTLPGLITKVFSPAGSWLVKYGNNLISGLQSGAQNIWRNMSSWLGSLPSTITNVFSGAISWLVSGGRNVISGLQNGAKNIWNNLNSWFRSLPSTITNIFNGAVNWLRSAGNNVMSGLRSGASSMWNSVRSWLSGIPNSIKSLFSGAGSWLRNAGSSIVNGLWNGLSSGWNWITRQVSSWGATLARIKGPEEYDKKLLVPNGEWITEGLLTGLTNKIPEVMDLMSGLAPMMAEEFSSNAGMTIQSAQPHNTGYNTGNRDNTTTVANPYLNQQDTVDNRPVVYVRTMIADKQGLRELKKQLDIVSAESDRWR